VACGPGVYPFSFVALVSCAGCYCMIRVFDTSGCLFWHCVMLHSIKLESLNRWHQEADVAADRCSKQGVFQAPSAFTCERLQRLTYTKQQAAARARTTSNNAANKEATLLLKSTPRRRPPSPPAAPADPAASTSAGPPRGCCCFRAAHPAAATPHPSTPLRRTARGPSTTR